MAKKEIKKSKKAGQKSLSSLSVHAEQAVQAYAQALELLRTKQYAEAASGFKSLLKSHPQEKEIADRCRLYLRVCERESKDKAVPLKRVDDYFYQGVLESNRQHYDEALAHLDRAQKLDPKDDRVVYAIASAHSLRGDREQALAALKDAIELNAVNRVQAQQDPDFDALRDDDAFIDMVLVHKD